MKQLNLKQSFDRLHYMLSKQNKPNQNDADAFAVICKNLKQQQTDTLSHHRLFAKLYALTLCEFLKYYTDIDFANQQINKILSEPLNLRLQLLQDALKTNELYRYFKQKKVLDSFLFTKTFEELIEAHSRYKNQLPQLNESEFFDGTNRWDLNEVIYNFETSVNVSLQNFKNHQ